jgi:hypothetical protein
MTVDRQPAIKRVERRHPASELPAPPPRADVAPAQVVSEQPVKSGSSESIEEKMTAQHNVRIRPSTKKRLTRAVSKLQFEQDDSSISAQSVTDAAINAYLDARGC